MMPYSISYYGLDLQFVRFVQFVVVLVPSSRLQHRQLPSLLLATLTIHLTGKGAVKLLYPPI